MCQCLLPLMVAMALTLVPAVYAQTCNDHIPATVPDSRYTNHGNGTVTDTATGLMWKQCPEGLSGADCGTGTAQAFTWQGALQQAQAATFAGHSDWRLPNVKELSSLVDRRCDESAINLTLFPHTLSLAFWSSSPGVNYSNYAWSVSFSYGDVYKRNKLVSLDVRLVRGGQ